MTDRRANHGREQRAVRKHQRREEGHPLFWLALGFLCGVMATLGVLLIWVGRLANDGVAVRTPLAAITAPPSAAALPAVAPSAKDGERTAGPSNPSPRAVQPSVHTAAPTPQTRSDADQMAEDAAASGLTTRTR